MRKQKGWRGKLILVMAAVFMLSLFICTSTAWAADSDIPFEEQREESADIGDPSGEVSLEGLLEVADNTKKDNSEDTPADDLESSDAFTPDPEENEANIEHAESYSEEYPETALEISVQSASSDGDMFNDTEGDFIDHPKSPDVSSLDPVDNGENVDNDDGHSEEDGEEALALFVQSELLEDYIFNNPDQDLTIAENLIRPGMNITVIAKTITVEPNVIISTRDILCTDYLEGLSQGNSGHITFTAKTIMIGQGILLLTHVEEGSNFSAGNIALVAGGEEFAWYWDAWAQDQASITVLSGSKLWAHGPEPSQAGDVTLTAAMAAGSGLFDIVGADVDRSRAEITLDGTDIRGGTVKITAEADHSRLFWDFEDEDEETMLEKLGELTVETSIEFLENFSLIGGVAVSNTEAIINIKELTTINASSFEADASATASAITVPLGLGVGVAVGVINSTVEVTIAGRITTAGDCMIKASSDNTLQVQADAGNISGAAFAVAVSVLNTKTTAQVTEAAVLDVGGSLTIWADTIDRNATLARSTSGKDGLVGISVAVSCENSETEALLYGNAVAGGDIGVYAFHTKESVLEKQVWGITIPSITTGVTAAAGVGTDSRGDLIDDSVAAAVEALLKKLGLLMNNTSSQLQPAAQNQTNPFEAAAAIAVYHDINKAIARIGNPESSFTQVVQSGGDITVWARVSSEPYIAACSSIDEPAGQQGSAGETRYAGSAAAAIGIFKNSATACIAGNSNMDAPGSLLVQAEVLNQYELVYGKNLWDIFFEPVEDYTTNSGIKNVKTGDIVKVLDGYRGGGEEGNIYKFKGIGAQIDLATVDYSDKDTWEDLGASWAYRLESGFGTITTYLDDNFGMRNNLVNTWSQSTAAGAQELNIAGAFTILKITNEAAASIDTGAKINQLDEEDEDGISFRNGQQRVVVKSLVVCEDVHFGGNIKLPHIQGHGKYWVDGTLLPGLGTGGDKYALGGTVLLIFYENRSKAEIKSGVVLYADSLEVTAESQAFSISITASGGQAGTLGFNGTFTLISIDNKTYAVIDNGARITVGILEVGDTGASVYVNAKDHTYIINISGGVAVAENIGIGASVSLNNVTRDTRAYIGHNASDSGVGKPENGEITLNSGGNILLNAENGGYIGSFSLAAAVSKDKSGDDSKAKDAPEGGGKFGLGVSADVSLNSVDDKALAYIRGAVVSAEDITLVAINDILFIAASGSGAIVKKDGTSIGLAGSYSQNTAKLESRSYIENSELALEGDLDASASTKGRIYSVAASGAAAPGDKGYAIAGQVSINSIKNETEAAVKGGSEVTARHVKLSAKSDAQILAVAGALAYGGKAGVGAAVAVNELPLSGRSSTRAYVESSKINASGDITLDAETTNRIMAITAALSAAKQGMALALSGSINTIDHDTEAYILKMEITADSITLKASDDSEIFSIAGGFAAGKQSIGIALAYNNINNTVKAFAAQDSEAVALGLITLTADSKAEIMSLSAGGGLGGKVSANGSVSINTINNDISAYIDNSRVSGNNGVSLKAWDHSEIGSIAGALGVSQGTALGAAVAVNYVGGLGSKPPHKVYAFIRDSQVISSAGPITITAGSDAVIKSISAVGGFSGKAALNGSVSVNRIYTDVAAFIDGCSGTFPGSQKQREVKALGDITLNAADNSAVSVIAGSIAGAGKAGVGAAVAVIIIGNGSTEGLTELIENPEIEEGEIGAGAEGEELPDGAYDYELPVFDDPGEIRAYIRNSNVESTGGSVNLEATSNNAIFNITAGAALGGAAGVQGSVAVNYINCQVLSLINNSRVKAKDDITLLAHTLKRDTIPRGALQVERDSTPVTGFDGEGTDEDNVPDIQVDPNSPEKLTSIQAIAGSVAGGGKAGVGVAVAVNYITNRITSAIVGSVIQAGNNGNVQSYNSSGIETISAAVAGAGLFAGAGSVSLNWIKNTVEAYIQSSSVTAKNLGIEARDRSFINSISGQVNIAGKTGIGGAAAYNEIKNTVKAYIKDCTEEENKSIITTGSILILADSKASITTISAGGSFAGLAGVSGTVAINIMENEVEAFITNSHAAAANNIYILAVSENAINSYGGAIGGGVFGMGAAVVVNLMDNTTRAYISDSRVTASGKGAPIQVIIWDDEGNESSEHVKGLAIIAKNVEAITIYSGAAGIGGGTISGQVSVNILANTTEAYIKNSFINSHTDQGSRVIVRAYQDTGLRIYTGSLAAGGGALGAAVDTTFIKHKTSAFIHSSEIYALYGVDVWSMTGYAPLGENAPSLIIAGVAVSGSLSVAGAVSVMEMENQSEAYITRSSVYSPVGPIRVHSHNNAAADVFAGTVSGSLYVGAGGSVVYSSFKNSSRAKVKGSKLNTGGAVEVIARFREDIKVKTGTAGVGALAAGVAGAVNVILIETTTEASVEGDDDEGSQNQGDDDDDSWINSKINQDARFRPGGIYETGPAQTVCILAYNQTSVDTTGGALGAGLWAGVGASIDYISIQNRTAAMVGAGTKIYAGGDVQIKAESNKEVSSQVYSIGGGLFGISGAVSIVKIGSAMDAEGAAEFNNDLRSQLDKDLSPNSLLTYQETDENGNVITDENGNPVLKNRLSGDGTALRAASAVSGISPLDLNRALDPLLDTSSKITAAFVQNAGDAGARAEIVSGGSVLVHALTRNDVTSKSSNWAIGGIAAGGTVARVTTRENTLACIGEYGYIRSGSLAVRAQSFDKVEAHCDAVAGALLVGVNLYSARAEVKPVIKAYLGSHADLLVTGNIQIDGEVTPEVSARVEGTTISGLGTVGLSKAEALVEPEVTAWIGDHVKIISGSEPVAAVVTFMGLPQLTGTPDLEFRRYTIEIAGDFNFTRGVVMAGQPGLVFDSSSRTITRSEGSWHDDGFKAGDLIIISGTWENEGLYEISEISADGRTITLTADADLTNETNDGSPRHEELLGQFVLDKDDEGNLTLQREGAGNGWSWELEELRVGDSIKAHLPQGPRDFRIVAMDGVTLTVIQIFVEEDDYLVIDQALSFGRVTLMKMPRKVSIMADGPEANDRMTYDDAPAGWTYAGQGFQVGDYIVVITPSSSPNSGIYQILGFEDEGRTAILDTQGYAATVSTTAKAYKEIPSEITRSKGCWIEDGFAPGQLIHITGTGHNDGYYEIFEIVNAGRTIRLYRGYELTEEDIPGAEVSITAETTNRIIRDEGSWVEDGFSPGQTIRITGSVKNDGQYRIKDISEDGKELILEAQNILENETATGLMITVEGEYNSILSINARLLLPHNGSGITASADAAGISGSILAALSGTRATAVVKPTVTAYVGSRSNLLVVGFIEVFALTLTRQQVYTDSINFGALSVSMNTAQVSSNSKTTAFVGGNTVIRGNMIAVIALGDESSYAEALSGGGGALSGLAAQAKTVNDSSTKASIGSGTQINVHWFTLVSDHTTGFNSRVDTVNASLVGLSGARVDNSVNARVDAVIGSGAEIHAYGIQVWANNQSLKDWLADGKHNVNSGSGGILDLPAARSFTNITHTTNLSVGDGAWLNVMGDRFYPGTLNLDVYNQIIAKDSAKLAAGAAIAVATAVSEIKANVAQAVTIGKNSLLTSVGDIHLSALAIADIETRVDVKTWGAASGASGRTLSRVDVVNQVTVDEHARLLAEGTVNLLTGKNSFDDRNNLHARAATTIDNAGVLPVKTDPRADGIINLNSYITIKEGARVESNGDTNLIAEKGPTISSGKASGKDWLVSILDSEIKGGTGKSTVTAIIWVDGSVEAGLNNQQVLYIDQDGNIVEMSDGITITREKMILAEHILSEIHKLKSLAVDYSGTEAGAAFTAQAQFLESELQRLGYNIYGEEPLPIVWVDLIIVDSIKVNHSNINVLAEGGSLIGSGTLKTSEHPARIEIINESPHYLVLNHLIIPEGQGGRLIYNYAPVRGEDLNREINNRNGIKDAALFNISTSNESGDHSPEIIVENNYDAGLHSPSIYIYGSIENVGSPGSPGKVTISSFGSIYVYPFSSIEAGELVIHAKGSFMLGYTDHFFEVGGIPGSDNHWGELATYMQKHKVSYPFSWFLYFLNYNYYLSERNYIRNLIVEILDEEKPVQGVIRGNNIFIGARYLNINGVIEAGQPSPELTLGTEVEEEINKYKEQIAQGVRTSTDYKDYPLHPQGSPYDYYYDPVQDAIVLESVVVRAGYVELFGHIISTGSGKIMANDGYGTINVNNQTPYDLVIKGLDTGLGKPGKIVITDTAEQKQKPGGDLVFLTTMYQRQYNPETQSYQVIAVSWYTDDRGNPLHIDIFEGSTAQYDPVEGYRYEWVMGQSVMQEEVYTYRSAYWLGIDWMAKDPDNLYSTKITPLGEPQPMPEGEYLVYDPNRMSEPYLYRYERREETERVLWGERNWSTQSWFLAPKYYYYEETYRTGYIDVYYHSIKADYPIAIEFGGSIQGMITLHSNKDLILEGILNNPSGKTTLSAGGSILQNSRFAIVARDVHLEAGQGIGGTEPILVELTGGLLSARTNSGVIHIRGTYDALTIGQVVNLEGNVYLSAQTHIVAASQESLVKGGLVELTARLGSIGSSAQPVRIDTGSAEGHGVVAGASGSIYLIEVNGSLRVISIVSESGDISLKADGLVSGDSDASVNIRAEGFWFQVDSNVGSSSSPLQTRVKNIEGSAVNGSVWISNTGGLVIGGMGTAADGIIAGGTVNITATSPITVSRMLYADGDIILTAADSAGSGDNIIVLSGGIIHSSGGSITLLAGDDIFLERGSRINAAKAVLLYGDFGNSGTGATVSMMGTISALQLEVYGNDGNDQFFLGVEALKCPVFIYGGGGNDQFTVNQLPASSYPVTLNGQGGLNTYIININGDVTGYIINIVATSGRDTLIINGTTAAEIFLSRAGYVAVWPAKDSSGEVQRINYDSGIGLLEIFGNGGPDRFYLDDNSTVTKIYGGSGNDLFQVGQVFASSPEGVKTVHTTRGFLTAGVSHETFIYGGGGNNTFSVNSNLAPLWLYGSSGNDTFIVRAFLLNKKGKSVYHQNDPVYIDGGAGQNSLIIVRGERGVRLLILKDGVYGAGLQVTFLNIHRFQVVRDYPLERGTGLITDPNEQLPQLSGSCWSLNTLVGALLLLLGAALSLIGRRRHLSQAA